MVDISFKGSVFRDTWKFNLMLSSYLFKTNVMFDEEFNAKGIQNNSIWDHIAKGYWENKPFLNLPYFTFRFPFTKG